MFRILTIGLLALTASFAQAQSMKTKVSDLSDAQIRVIYRGWPYNQATCAINNIDLIDEKHQGDQWEINVNEEFGLIAFYKVDSEESIYCGENAYGRTEQGQINYYEYRN